MRGKRGVDTKLYYYGARYYDPRVSIWLSVDPLAEKYPSIGGYTYVANNPIKYIDPDGERIIIWTRRGNGTYKQTEYTYVKNRDYTEIAYSYERNAMKLLDKMYEKDVNKKFLDDAISSKKDLNIIKPSKSGLNVFQKGIGLYKDKKKYIDMRHIDSKNNIGTILWDDEHAIRLMIKKEKGKPIMGNVSPAGAGLHEINHAEHYFFCLKEHTEYTAIDKKTEKPLVTPPFGFPNQEEYRNTIESNEESVKMDLPDDKRTIYGTGVPADKVKVDDIFKNK